MMNYEFNRLTWIIFMFFFKLIGITLLYAQENIIFLFTCANNAEEDRHSCFHRRTLDLEAFVFIYI